MSCTFAFSLISPSSSQLFILVLHLGRCSLCHSFLLPSFLFFSFFFLLMVGRGGRRFRQKQVWVSRKLFHPAHIPFHRSTHNNKVIKNKCQYLLSTCFMPGTMCFLWINSPNCLYKGHFTAQEMEAWNCEEILSITELPSGTALVFKASRLSSGCASLTTL